jgi:hypothetical protein
MLTNEVRSQFWKSIVTLMPEAMAQYVDKERESVASHR